jgi:hypothetical protein
MNGSTCHFRVPSKYELLAWPKDIKQTNDESYDSASSRLQSPPCRREQPHRMVPSVYINAKRPLHPNESTNEFRAHEL